MPRQARHGGGPERVGQIRRPLFGPPGVEDEDRVPENAEVLETVEVALDEIVVFLFGADERVQSVECRAFGGRVEGGVTERFGPLAVQPQTEAEAEVRRRLEMVLDVEPGAHAGGLVLDRELRREEDHHGLSLQISVIASPAQSAGVVGNGDDLPRLRRPAEVLALGDPSDFQIVAALRPGDIDAEVLSEGEALALVLKLLEVGAFDDAARLPDSVVAVGQPGHEVPVRIKARGAWSVVEDAVAVAILRAAVESAVVVDILEEGQDPIAVPVFVDVVQVAVAVPVFPQ